MGYKTILVHAQADPASYGRATLAMALAEVFDAAVYGVGAEAWFSPVPLPNEHYYPFELMEGLQRDAHDRLEAARMAYHALASKRGRPLLWLSAEGYPLDALVRAAEGADLLIADRCTEAGPESLVAHPADLIMETGLPVLLVADGLRTIHAERVVIGWKNTRESRKALNEALPFLRRADQTHLVQVAEGPDLAMARYELNEAAGRLARHGVNVQTQVLAEHDDVCQALETFAEHHGVDLIVLGAYGHSRLRETILGGVTRGFLTRCRVHVLFSR